MTFPDGRMKCITGGKAGVSQYDFLGSLYDRLVNGEDLIHDAQQGIERELDGIPPADRRTAVQDFLKDLGVSYQALPICDQFFQ